VPCQRRAVAPPSLEHCAKEQNKSARTCREGNKINLLLQASAAAW